MRTDVILSVAALAASVATSLPACAEPAIERGEYLTTLMLCADCHSPPTDEGGPDMSRAFSGGLGFEVSGLGIFWAPNLTPAQSGLAEWSEDDIVRAIREGKRPDGRELAPIMPWRFFAALTYDDAESIARYLKSMEAIENSVPSPVASGEAATAPYLTMVAPPAPKS